MVFKLFSQMPQCHITPDISPFVLYNSLYVLKHTGVVARGHLSTGGGGQQASYPPFFPMQDFPCSYKFWSHAELWSPADLTATGMHLNEN